MNKEQENTAVQVFSNPAFGEVRALEIDGEPWFVGKDVASALGYKEPTKAARERVDAQDKGVSKIDTPYGEQEMIIINESGLYSLIMSSKLPTAREFQRWVTSDVLPSIRKHGAYMTPETLEAAILNPDTMIRLCQQLKDEKKKRVFAEMRVQALEDAAEENKPKIAFADSVTTSDECILVADLAKILFQNGIKTGQNRLFRWLRERGYLIKRDGPDHNMPTQKSIERGLFEVQETLIRLPGGGELPKLVPMVTGKGQVYFLNLFLAEKQAEEDEDGE